MKRTMAPKFWPINRKNKKYTIRPVSGPHSKERCMPLGIILRDVLHYAHTAKESQTLLNKGDVMVDGRVRKSNNFPVGLMDILTIGEENYRILPNATGFYLKKIEENEKHIKPSKIVSKTIIKKGKMQLNLFDGHNIVSDKGDYATGDTIVLDLRKGIVTQIIKMKKGAIAIVTGGKNAGKLGKVGDVTTAKMRPSQVTLEHESGKIIVPKDNVFVIGDKEPVIKIGE